MTKIEKKKVMNPTLSSLKEMHLFQVNGSNYAFNPKTYGVMLLGDESYASLKEFTTLRDVAIKPAITKVVDNLSSTQFLKAMSRNSSTSNQPEQLPQIPITKSLCLVVTSQCNMGCDYCFNDGGRYNFSNRQRMTQLTANKAVEFLLSNKYTRFEIGFFGGEPLLAFPLIQQTVEFAERLARSKKVKVRFHVTTNGTLITPEIARFLHKHDFSIIVSIDGNEDIHNYHRKLNNGNSTYHLAMAGAKLLLAEYGNQSKITIRGTYTHQQMSFTDSFLHLAHCGFENISIEPCMDCGLNEQAIGINDIDKLSQEYGRLASIYKEVQKTYPRISFFHFRKTMDDLSQARRANTPCGAANGYMAIAPNGGIYPCHRILDERYNLGNLYSATREQDVIEETRKTFLEAKTNNRDICRSCWARTLCGGSCYAYGIEKGHDINSYDEVSCKITKLFIERAITLFAERELSRDGGVQKIDDGIIIIPQHKNGDKAEMSGCDYRASCDYGCQSDCMSSCTSGCQMGCTSGCTGGCTSCDSSCTSGCTDSCTTSCEDSCTSSCTEWCTSGCTASCTSWEE